MTSSQQAGAMLSSAMSDSVADAEYTVLNCTTCETDESSSECVESSAEEESDNEQCDDSVSEAEEAPAVEQPETAGAETSDGKDGNEDDESEDDQEQSDEDSESEDEETIKKKDLFDQASDAAESPTSVEPQEEPMPAQEDDQAVELKKQRSQTADTTIPDDEACADGDENDDDDEEDEAGHEEDELQTATETDPIVCPQQACADGDEKDDDDDDEDEHEEDELQTATETDPSVCPQQAWQFAATSILDDRAAVADFADELVCQAQKHVSPFWLSLSILAVACIATAVGLGSSPNFDPGRLRVTESTTRVLVEYTARTYDVVPPPYDEQFHAAASLGALLRSRREKALLQNSSHLVVHYSVRPHNAASRAQKEELHTAAALGALLRSRRGFADKQSGVPKAKKEVGLPNMTSESSTSARASRWNASVDSAELLSEFGSWIEDRLTRLENLVQVRYKTEEPVGLGKLMLGRARDSQMHLEAKDSDEYKRAREATGGQNLLRKLAWKQHAQENHDERVNSTKFVTPSVDAATSAADASVAENGTASNQSMESGADAGRRFTQLVHDVEESLRELEITASFRQSVQRRHQQLQDYYLRSQKSHVSDTVQDLQHRQHMLRLQSVEHHQRMLKSARAAQSVQQNKESSKYAMKWHDHIQHLQMQMQQRQQEAKSSSQPQPKPQAKTPQPSKASAPQQQWRQMWQSFHEKPQRPQPVSQPRKPTAPQPMPQALKQELPQRPQQSTRIKQGANLMQRSPRYVSSRAERSQVARRPSKLLKVRSHDWSKQSFMEQRLMQLQLQLLMQLQQLRQLPQMRSMRQQKGQPGQHHDRTMETSTLLDMATLDVKQMQLYSDFELTSGESIDLSQSTALFDLALAGLESHSSLEIQDVMTMQLSTGVWDAFEEEEQAFGVDYDNVYNLAVEVQDQEALEEQVAVEAGGLFLDGDVDYFKGLSYLVADNVELDDYV